MLLRFDPPPDPYQTRPAGVQVFARDGTLLRGFLSPDEKWRLRVPLNQISTCLVLTVLEHEDRWFFRHPGVNPFAALRAVWSNLSEGRIVTGASTITMQLARLVEPGRRSYRFKTYQAYRALQYESLYTKKKILEMYLNLAPYGGNVEGVGAASRIYFDKPPLELSPAEAALLAILPQSPAGRHPIRFPERAEESRNRLIDRLAKRGILDADEVFHARSHPLPRKIHAVPFRAPHFCEWVPGYCGIEGSLHTTIDPVLQEETESLVRSHVLSLRQTGIGQAAVVILDYERSEIVAMAGSASFFDSLHQGQVNGTVARRSPGSTLKPFVYSLAFDQGLATPSTLLEDVPVHLGLYHPENYDGTYKGAIVASEALQTSRNVPAVMLTSRLLKPGRLSLYRFLRRAGVASIDRPANHYGLSLVLGGGDVTLLELAGLYATLARQGVYLPIRVTVSEAERGEGARLLSREASWLTLNVMTDTARPELNDVWRSGTDLIPIPWKTGTSYGHRDAWSVGVAGNYVVAVWVGNFDGRGIPGLVGRDVAAPLLFDLAGILPRSNPGSWHDRPRGIRTRTVCAVSGAPPSEHCPDLRTGFFIPGISPTEPCGIHREIEIDRETGLVVCSRCRIHGNYVSKVVEWWPPRIATFLRSGGVSIRNIPAHNPECPVFGSGAPPVIVSPQEGMEYHMRPDVPLEDQRIALVASADPGSRDLYWFLNGTMVWRGGPEETGFLDPTPGRHRLSVKDESGRTTTTTFTVVR